MTHEEVATDLARRELRSHRHLPALVYQIQTKVRDEPRPRGGLLRLRECLTNDAYSFHRDAADLDAFFPRIHAAYAQRLPPSRRRGAADRRRPRDDGRGRVARVRRCPVRAARTRSSAAPACGYAASAEAAVARKGQPWQSESSAGPPSWSRRPAQRRSARSMCHFDRPAAAFLKSVFYALPAVPRWTPRCRAGVAQIVVAAIRGDLDVSEAKLARVVGRALGLATDEELRAAGISAGSASPVGLAGPSVRVVVDDSVPGGAYVAGGEPPRLPPPRRRLRPRLRGRGRRRRCRHAPDRPAARCGGTLEAPGQSSLAMRSSSALATAARLARPTSTPTATAHPIAMGSYGIGIDRLLAAVVEAHHDDKGILWPTSVAPYHVYLCAFGVDSPEVRAAAEELEEALTLRGVEVLYDDRPEPPGVKFNDADLIGLPVRVVVSGRSLKVGEGGSAEIKRRGEREVATIPLADAAERVFEYLAP